MKKIINVVGAIFENEIGEIFCAKRPSDKTFGGMWEFPGGKIEEGETPEEALKREIQEELNIEVEVGILFDKVESEYENFYVKLSCYFCKIIDDSDFKLVEHQETKWVKKEKLLELDWLPTDIPVVEKLKM